MILSIELKTKEVEIFDSKACFEREKKRFASMKCFLLKTKKKLAPGGERHNDYSNRTEVHFSVDCLSQSLNCLLQLRALGQPVRFCPFKKVLYFIRYLSSFVMSSPDVFVNYVYKNNIRNKSDLQC